MRIAIPENLTERIPADLVLVLFLPGYSLIAALFPRRDDPDGTRTIALSFRAWASLLCH